MRALALLLATAACTTGEWSRTYDGHVPGTTGDDVQAVLVTDALTGKPLPRVRVRVYREVIEPDKELAPLVAEFETDEYGILTTPWDKRYFNCHWVYDLPQYAPVDDFPGEAEWIELAPGRSVRGQLLMPNCRPAPHCDVEYYVGCPHSPTVRTARTDARGAFVLRDIDPDEGALWVVAPTALAESWPLRLAPTPGYVLEPIQLRPGVSYTGEVVKRTKWVYSPDGVERGPRVRPGADGRVEIHGLPAGARLPGVRIKQQRTTETKKPPPGPIRRIVIKPPDHPHNYRFWIDEGEDVTPGADGVAVLTTRRYGALRIGFSYQDVDEGVLVAYRDEIGAESFPARGDLKIERGPVAFEVEVYRRLGWEPVDLPSFALVPGSWVRLRRDGWMPLTKQLNGPGPWRLRWGSATLELDVAPREFVCIVDGHTLDAPRELRGLEPGPHTILLGARGRRPIVRQIRLHPGDNKLHVALRNIR